jgi:1-acyl-sn-glycerol-3-phosphate acyltransferase
MSNQGVNPQSDERSNPDTETNGSGPEFENHQRSVLIEELDALIEKVRSLHPEYEPPPFSPRTLLSMIEMNLGKLSPEFQLGILQKLKSTITEDLFDLDTWKGVWYMLNYSLEYQADILKRRMTGDYETDEWGLDQEFIDAIRPFFEFLYTVYWRVEVSGIENVPQAGRALMVCNHSGQLPWDGSMIAAAVIKEHPSQRLVRTLYADWFPTLPFFSSSLEKLGQVLANEENGTRLLENDELVAVFPEGYKGVGKLFKERYRLARFGRGGFVQMALKTRAPMIPVSVVGAEETYISLAKSQTIARAIGFPYFPISITWPWLGLLGFVPLPTKWFIDFGKPISLDGYSDDAVNNLVLISQLADQTRNIVQQQIFNRLAKRRSIFFG